MNRFRGVASLVLVWVITIGLVIHFSSVDLNKKEIITKSGVVSDARCADFSKNSFIDLLILYEGEQIKTNLGVLLKVPCDESLLRSVKNKDITVSKIRHFTIEVIVGGYFLLEAEESISMINDPKGVIFFLLIIALACTFVIFVKIINQRG